jgi:hypothetical protein
MEEVCLSSFQSIATHAQKNAAAVETNWYIEYRTSEDIQHTLHNPSGIPDTQKVTGLSV